MSATTFAQRRYALSPEMADFVARTLAFSTDDNDPVAQRAVYRRMCRAFTPPRQANLAVTDMNLLADGERVPVRRYLPTAPAPESGWQCVLYFHGGGWMLGDLDTHDFITAALAATLNAAVIAVDYRLAPEHPFPAAADDALTAWRALQMQHRELGVDRSRIAVAGDSSGGNLAAGLCMALRGTDAQQPCGQALIYPVLTDDARAPAYREHADAPLLSAREMARYIDLYLPDIASRRDPRAMPLAAERFERLPPAFVAVAEFDPLCDDGVEYARRLRQDGTMNQLYFGTGLVHGCLRARGLSRDVDRLYEALTDALARFLAER